MTDRPSTLLVWSLMVVIGVGSWATRMSFFVLVGRSRAIGPTAGRILRLIPAAVLTALVVPGLTRATGSFDLTTTRFAAGVVAAVVAWRSRNVLATIAAGMATLWLLEALV